MSAVTPEGRRDPRLRRPGWSLVVAVGVAGVLFGYLLGVVGPRDEDPVALPTTSTTADTTTVTQPTGPVSGPAVEQPELLAAGWEELDRPPVATVSAWAWSESGLFAWAPSHVTPGQPAAYVLDPDTGSWRAAAPLPESVCFPLREAVAFDAGGKVVVVGRPAAFDPCDFVVAYDPTLDAWEPLDGEFFGKVDRQRTEIVWTERLAVAPGLGLGYEWMTGDMFPVPPAPSDADTEVFSPQRPHWTGDRFLILGSGPLRGWALGDAEWVTLAEPPVPDRARDSVWTDQGLLAVNYRMAAAFYRDDTWVRPGDLPLQFAECHVEALSVGGTPVVLACRGIAIWDEVRNTWVVALHHQGWTGQWPTSWPTVIAGEDALYAVDANFVRRLRISRDEDGTIVVQPTIPLGFMHLDIPDGFALVSSFAPLLGPTETTETTGDSIGLWVVTFGRSIGFGFDAEGGRRCTISSGYGELITDLGDRGFTVARPGRSPLDAVIQSAPENAARLAVQAPFDNLVTVLCEAPRPSDAMLDAMLFVAGLWTPREASNP